MREHYDYHSGLERVKEEVRQGEELRKRSMDEMISYFNQRVSEMNISAMDKVTILGLITAIGFKYEEDTKAAQPKIIDGRLFVTVDDIEKVGCVLVDEHKSNFCRQFWMDGDGPVPCEDAVSRRKTLDLVRDVCAAILSGCKSHYDGDDEVYDDLLEVDAILKCNKEIRKAISNMSSVTPKQAETECCADCKYDGYGRIGECARCCYSYASHFANK